MRDQTATDAASTIPGDESFMDVLLSLPSTDRDYSEKLMFLSYTKGLGHEKTFFVRTGDLTDSFRHGGDLKAIPPFVHVTVSQRDMNDVHVYNEHSWVGKTVCLHSFGVQTLQFFIEAARRTKYKQMR